MKIHRRVQPRDQVNEANRESNKRGSTFPSNPKGSGSAWKPNSRNK
jgi:hypothetical protein|tara:strand:- start:117 stop:254 length:138 start_codon:yes stop_codon:yes gene_type:complete